MSQPPSREQSESECSPGDALREREARLAAALRAAKIGVYDCDLRTKQIIWDAVVYRLWGVPEGEPVTYETFEACVHPEDVAAVRQVIAAALDWEGAHHYECEYRVINRADGSLRWVLTQGDATFDASLPVRLLGTVQDITARKDAEAALRKSEERYRQLFDNMTEGFLLVEPILDDEGKPISYRYLAANPALERLTNLKRKDILGKDVRDVLPSIEGRWIETFTRVALTGEPSRIEEFSQDLGQWYDVYAYCPRPGHAALIYTNVTAQKQAETALRESQAQLRAVLDGSLDPIFMKDREGRMVLANPPTCAAVGKPPAGILGKTDAEFLEDPADARAIMANDQRIMASGEPETVEETVTAASGTRYYVNKKAPRRDAAGNVIGLISTARDVTEQKRAEEALRENEQRLRLATEAAKIGTFDLNILTGVNVWSAELEAMHGLAPGEFGATQASWEKLVHPDDRATALARCAESLATGNPVEHEWRIVWRDGSIHWISARFQCIQDTTGKPVRLTGVNIDITERKRAEEQILLLLREVNHRSKNMLAVVQSIARQTIAANPEDFLERFGQRVEALAASQDLLIKHEWRSIELEELVRFQLMPFGDLLASRIDLHGPQIFISPSAAQMLGMAIHELAMNAGKYGALSGLSGRVNVGWRLANAENGEQAFVMSWSEVGGPPVVKPTRLGFGSNVIGPLTESSLNGTVELGFGPAGLTWRLTCPAKELVEGPQPSQARAHPVPASRPSQTIRRILVVEDEPLVALEIAHILKKAGFEVVGPTRDVAGTLSLLEQSGCDAAALDINLGRETSEPVARELIKRNTPFLTLSGYSDTQQADAFGCAPTLTKPIRPQLLIATIRQFFADGACVAGEA
jgi:PAS domain S-box-containing protein